MKLNFRRFGRRRLLSIRVSEFHLATFPVVVKQFQVTKAKTAIVKSFCRPIASVRVNRNSVAAAREIAQHLNA
jgi:hypothetical protein